MNSLAIAIVVLALLLLLVLCALIVFLAIASGKLRMLKVLKTAVLAAIGTEDEKADLLPIPEAPPFSAAFDATFALYGISLLSNFAQKQQLKNALTYVYFEGKPFACLYKNSDETLFLLIRGTQTQSEMHADLDFQQKDNVHKGFLGIFDEIWPSLSKALKTFRQRHLAIFGHSLGAAVATLVMKSLQQEDNVGGDTLGDTVGYTFGSPRVGDRVFAEAFDSHKSNWYNILNSDDIVTQFPLSVMPNPRRPSKPLFYQHVGDEITFSTNWGSWVYNHLLPIYRAFLMSF
jgi:hypothetical protein